MAKRVQAPIAAIAEDYDGDAARVWADAADSTELEEAHPRAPGFGDMKVIALGATLSKRFGVRAADGLSPVVPDPRGRRLGRGVEEYQAKKRAWKAERRAAGERV